MIDKFTIEIIHDEPASFSVVMDALTVMFPPQSGRCATTSPIYRRSSAFPTCP